MIKHTRFIIITLIICLLPTSVFAYSTNATENESQNARQISAKVSVAKPKFPKVRRTSDTSLQINWKKVSGVNGYVIYRYDSTKKKYRKVKTIRKRATTKWTNKKLKTNKIYKYKVKSYKRLKGKKVYSGFTYTVSAKTYKKSAEKVNVGKVSSKNKVTVGIAGKVKVETSVKPAKYGNAKRKSVINKDIRFVSANSNIVVDGKKGTLRGKKPGVTNVYAVTHNGNLKKIRVTVKDYAKPATWNNLNEVDEESRQLLTEYSSLLKDIASYFSTHKISQGTTLYIDDSGKLINETSVPIAMIEQKVLELTKNSPFRIVITSTNNAVHFDLYLGSSQYPYTQTILYQYNYDISESDAQKDGTVKLAKQWFFWRFMPI